MLTALLFLVVLSASVYFMFLIFVYGGLQKVKTVSHSKIDGLPHVAVIVPFRNEEENLPGLIESLKNQTYPQSHLQIILVNDASTDNSKQVAEKLMGKNFMLIESSADGERAFKKKAIEQALKFVHAEIIVTTDADCWHPREWIETLASYFDEETGVVSAPVVFRDENSFFAKLQKLEFAGLVLVGAGLIGGGKPIIANAANFAYRKKAFDAVGGYSDNKHLTSGDDELLMQKIANETSFEIKFAWNKNAIVTTKPNGGLNDFLEQRKRWASKSLFYFDKTIVALLFSIFIFYASLLTLFFASFFGFAVKWFLFLFTLKMLFEYLIVKEGKDFLFDKKLLRYFLIAELLHIPYIIFSALGGVSGNYVWKGRKVKR